VSDPYLVCRERVAKGEWARAYLDDPVFKGVLDQIERDAVVQWKLARGPAGMGTREQAHGMAVGIDAIRGHLAMMVDDGELARTEMQQLELTSDEEEI
jgi:hypothetical protein